LYSAAGKRIASSSSGVVDAALPDAALYTVIVSDRGARTGLFSAVVQRLNAPCGAAPLNCGQTASGAIANRGQFNFHTLTVDKGDAVTIRIGKTAGEIEGYLELYAPDGERLTATGSRIDRALTAAGTYTLVLSDYNRNRTGGYSLVWQKLNAPCNATAISCGQPARGAISGPALYNFYTMTVAGGDAVTIRLRGVSGKLDDYLELYAPDGSRLATADSPPLDRTLAAGGVYTLIVSDYYSKESGAYSLVWQKLNAPCNAATISCGETASGSISTGAQVFYTLDGTPRDAVTIRTAPTSGSLLPYLELYGFDGSLIDYGSTINATLPDAGPYSLAVSDSSVTRAGTYGLVWQKRNGPCGAKTLVCGEAASGAIQTPVALNAYAFDASAGDELRVRSRYWAGSSYLYLELYDQTGARVTTGSDSIQATLAAGGRFGLLIGPSNRTDTSRYSLTLNRVNDSCALVDDEAPQVTLITPRGGEALLAGSAFTISWKSIDNDQVSSQQIKLSTDGGQTFSTVVADGLAGNASTFEWNIPEKLSTPTARMQVVAVDSVGHSGDATSAANFSVLGVTLPEAKKTTYQYDPLGRLTNVVYSDGSSITYEYDAVGNITRITKTGANQNPVAKDD
jgi:YD repeat-containing protein